MLTTYWSVLVLLSIIGYSNGVKTCKLANMTANSILVTKDNEFAMEANNTAVSYNESNVVSLRCHDTSKMLSGPGVLTCKNGTWTPKQPYCKAKPPPPVVSKQSPSSKTTRTKIVGGSVGGGVLFLVLVIFLVIALRLRFLRQKKLREQSQLVHEENSEKINADDTKQSMSRFYKVWTCGRKTKHFIKACGLSHLMSEAAQELRKTSIVKVVLEEDGTEVTTDNILKACAEKTLMVLAAGELWWDANNTSEDGRITAPRITFDVCTEDRSRRKLLLAENLNDLFIQGKVIFGYLPSRACLETDGTIITDDVPLFAFADKTIMLLKSGGSWFPSGNEASGYGLPDIKRSSGDGLNWTSDNRLFKVWSKDCSVKMAVFAKDLADLHIKAARAHGLSNPVEISLLSSGDVVSSEKQLTESENEILLIVSLNQPSRYYYIDEQSMKPLRGLPNGTKHPEDRDLVEQSASNDFSVSGSMNHGFERGQTRYEEIPYQKVQKQRRQYQEYRNGEIPIGLGNSNVPNGRVHNDKIHKKAKSVDGYGYAERESEHSIPVTNNWDHQTLPKDNFGFLREMSDRSKRSYNSYEMENFGESQKNAMLITGGAKQSSFSDVLF